MRTFNNIIENMDICPGLIEFAIECVSGIKTVTGTLIQECIVKSSIPKKFSTYDIRHFDNAFCLSIIKNNIMAIFKQ